MKKSNRENKEKGIILAAETLKHFVVLQEVLQEEGSSQQCPAKRGPNKEHHPKLVLSTKSTATTRKPGEASPPAAPSTQPNRCTVVSSPRCTVSRQRSTPVDLPMPSPPVPVLGAGETLASSPPLHQRPASLNLRRDPSCNSGSDGVTPLQCSPDGRQLGASYPPGPELSRVQCHEACYEACYESISSSGLHAEYLSETTSHQQLARRIAERLITIGDEFNTNNDTFTVADILESFATSLSLNHGADLSWCSIRRLYGALSRLLTQTLHGNHESWAMFDKLWKEALQTISTWIADNGGWYALIRHTDNRSSSGFMTSTPHCGRRFTYSHPPPTSSAGFSTPQIPRRQNHSTPILRPAHGSERGSRVLSLTEEGVFHLEGHTGEGEVSGGEEEDERSPDEGIQFSLPNGSQSSFGSELFCSGSPDTSVGPQPRPQSSTNTTVTVRRECLQLSGEVMVVMKEEEVSVFDRNRSMSYPTRRRPSSAGMAASTQRRRQAYSMTEAASAQEQGMRDSQDSGLAACSSETSITSTDSMQFSALGVSAVCILEAVKSMLDHK